MPQTFPQEHRPPTKPTVTRLNTSAKGPVVYKREKLKLRATLSPAILQHLEDSTVKESVDSGGSVCPSNVTNPFTPDRGTAKKNIKWHTKEVKFYVIMLHIYSFHIVSLVKLYKYCKMHAYFLYCIIFNILKYMKYLTVCIYHNIHCKILPSIWAVRFLVSYEQIILL